MMFRQWLDRLTGRFTMYVMVLALLIAISLLSVILAFAGVLPFDPLLLVASLVAAVTSTVVSSMLFARGYRTTAHLPSAAITGILVFIVVVPASTPPDLLPILATGVIASASKYLITFRGRHIFNPAAMAGVLATGIGITFSGWWVATPALLPLIAVGAFLILYRTRRLTMGVLFIAVALIVDLIRFGMSGDPAAGFSFALLSSPAIFIAGFMLTEPLTMPPRRWQQLLIAVIAALLFTIPFNVGELYSSPQLAIVVANLVAFGFGQRRDIRLAFVSKRQLTPATWEFTFDGARKVRFTPGQYMELTVAHPRPDARGTRRMFSISSAPDDTITFAMTITYNPSSFKKALLDLEPGDTVRGSLVAGDFVLPASLDTPVLLVAGGIGITPFASQLAHAIEREHQRDLVVVYAVRDASELAYSSLLERSGARVVVTAPNAPDSLPAGWTYGGPRLTPEALLAEVPDAASRRAFVSGPPSLVNSVRSTLRAAGARRVTSDYFDGY